MAEVSVIAPMTAASSIEHAFTSDDATHATHIIQPALLYACSYSSTIRSL